jgi:hypothetical protein
MKLIITYISFANMAFKYISPSSYVKSGELIKAMFIDDDTFSNMKWYNGKVTRVHRRGRNDYGKYVECNIRYEDGEFAKKTRLYDRDFCSDASMDAWMFSSPAFTSLIKDLEANTKESKKLQDIVDYYKGRVGLSESDYHEHDSDSSTDIEYLDSSSDGSDADDESYYTESTDDDTSDDEEMEDDGGNEQDAYDSGEDEEHSNDSIESKRFCFGLRTLLMICAVYFTARIAYLVTEFEPSVIPSQYRKTCKLFDLRGMVARVLE